MDCEGHRDGREHSQEIPKAGKPEGDYDSPALSEQVGGRGEYWQDLEMEWMLEKERQQPGQRRRASLDGWENHGTNNRNREVQAGRK